MYVLAQKRVLEDLATLYCIERDIGRREIEMKKNSDNLWEKINDSMEEELSKLTKLKVAVCEIATLTALPTTSNQNTTF